MSGGFNAELEKKRKRERGRKRHNEEVFSRGSRGCASLKGRGPRGDAAIIVQIKEDVNSLSFAWRVTTGIFNGDGQTG